RRMGVTERNSAARIDRFCGRIDHRRAGWTAGFDTDVTWDESERRSGDVGENSKAGVAERSVSAIAHFNRELVNARKKRKFIEAHFLAGYRSSDCFGGENLGAGFENHGERLIFVWIGNSNGLSDQGTGDWCASNGTGWRADHLRRAIHND